MSRAELRWVLCASALVLLLASLPTVYAWSLADADHVFTGFVYNTEDGNSYLAKMRQGARGEWLFHFSYSLEDHEGALVYPFYLLLGRLARGLGLSLILTYHLARIVLGLGLLLTIYAFIGTFTPDVGMRRLAWALAAVGSGLGWLLTLLGATDWLGALPLDFWVPEAYVFLVLFSLPHLALAEGLLLWALIGNLRAFAGEGLRWSLLAGVCAFVMSWIVPFYAGVLAAVLGAYLLALLIRRRRLPGREASVAALTAAFTLPSLVYNVWVFTSNPAFRTWAAQNRILSPHPLHYLLGYALLLVPAIWGAFQAIRAGEDWWLLPVAWVVLTPLLLYIPFNLQRRMVVAVQVPLALLAALGSWIWLRSRRRAMLAYVAVASLSNLLLIAASLESIQSRTPPIFRPADEIVAFTWLGLHSSPDEAVLTSTQTGNALPAWTDLRVFAGHGPETLNYEARVADLRRFFETQSDDAWRQALLDRFGVNYVLYGPQEQALGGWDPASAVYLTAIYRQGDYTIFQVTEMEQP